MNCDVAIIGAGVSGACVARTLSAFSFRYGIDHISRYSPDPIKLVISTVTAT
jgi:uncharacterized NAD(P)/FAD-binding protein YdhS